MPHPLATHLGLDHLDAALLADDTTMLHALVLAAIAFVVLDRPKDLRAEEAIPLRLECPVVDRFGLLDFAERPLADLVRRGKGDPQGESNAEGILRLLEEVVEIAQSGCLLCPASNSLSAEQRWTSGPGMRSIGRPRRALGLVLDHLDIETERLKLLDEHVEALGQAGLQRVLTLDDGLIDPGPAHHIVRLDGQELLERVGRRHMLRGPTPPSHRGAVHRTAPCRPEAAG